MLEKEAFEILDEIEAVNTQVHEAQWFLDLIHKASENDKIIVNVTQCLAGSVNMNIYATGKSLKNEGVCNGYDSTSESALGKLFYLMGESEDNALVKSRLEDVLRGEISK